MLFHTVVNPPEVSGGGKKKKKKKEVKVTIAYQHLWLSHQHFKLPDVTFMLLHTPPPPPLIFFTPLK